MMTEVDSFLKYIRYELNLSAHTVSAYKNDLLQFSEYICGTPDREPDFKSVTVNDIRSWVVDLAEHKTGASSVRRKIQSLRAFFKWMQRRGRIENNPAMDVDLAKTPKRLPSWVREDVMDGILAEPYDKSSLDEVRKHLILTMFYETGIRRAELISLLDKDVDIPKGEIKVLGKRNKQRIIPIGEGLEKEISEYREMRNHDIGDTVEFFVRNDGKPLSPSFVYKIVNDALSSAGVEKRSPHVLRHTFASAMLNNGAEINSVKEILGHQSLAATQIYTHITISDLKLNYQQAHPRAIKKGG